MMQFWMESEAEGKVRGVFSTSVKARIGYGETRRTTMQDVLVFVEEQEDGRMAVQSLNSNFVPTGEIHYIGREKLLDQYVPEPSVYMQKVAPAMRGLGETVERAEKHYRKGETFSAEYEFKNALRVDEDNIRATFGLGLTYLDRGESDKGALVFRRLVALKGAFEDKHKHLFNEFGIQLRRNKLYPEALKYYARAYQLSRDDEHLLYNMARTLYEKGNYAGGSRLLRKALSLRPDFPEAQELQTVVEQKWAAAKQVDRSKGAPQAGGEAEHGAKRARSKGRSKALSRKDRKKPEVERKDRYKAGI